MKKRTICVNVFSRANYARIKTTLQAIRRHPNLELLLVVAGPGMLWRFGDIREVLEKDGFDQIDATIYTIIEGENPTTMTKSVGLGIIELATTFERLKPDIVVTIADRFETMATAIAASYMNIPLAHTQGGEVTGSLDESVRHSITKLANYHFPSTKLAETNIVKMGENPDNVFLTGCPSIDLVAHRCLTLPDNIFSQFDVPSSILDPSEPFLLVLQHPVTTEYGHGRDQIDNTIDAVKAIGLPTVWIWPNADAGSDNIAKGLRIGRENMQDHKIWFFLNFTPEDYACLLANTKCLIGNSSSGIREGAYLGTPVVNIGTRQNNRERGRNVIDTSYDKVEIEQAIRQQLAHGRYESDQLFGDGKAGERMARILTTVDLHVEKSLTYGETGNN